MTGIYKELVNKLKEVEENMSNKTSIKRIDSLQVGLRKKLNKIKLSKRTGSGKDELYRYHLWYFDMLLFLMD